MRASDRLPLLCQRKHETGLEGAERKCGDAKSIHERFPSKRNPTYIKNGFLQSLKGFLDQGKGDRKNTQDGAVSRKMMPDAGGGYILARPTLSPQSTAARNNSRREPCSRC